MSVKKIEDLKEGDELEAFPEDVSPEIMEVTRSFVISAFHNMPIRVSPENSWRHRTVRSVKTKRKYTYVVMHTGAIVARVTGLELAVKDK